MIEREERDGIVTLRLAHGKANAMDLEFSQGMSSALQDASSARAVILTGTGKIFSAGVDLIRLTNEGAAYVQKFFPALNEVLFDLLRFPRPLVAAINGHAIAGGCLIACAADYRLMSGGTIGVPELSVGVPFPAIAIEILRFATGTNAHRLATLGEVIPADEAKARGVVHEVVEADALMSRANEVAQRFAAIPSDAFRLTKMHLREPYLREARAHDAIDREAESVWSSQATHDHIKGYLARTLKK
jgi:enoyl-CoA hydratase